MKYFKFARVALVSMAVFSQASHGALYQVTEIDTHAVSKNAFPVDMNESGDIVMSLTYSSQFPLAEYNIPIDLSLIDFESETLQDNLTDIEAAQNGNFNLEDYQTILSVIRAGQGVRTVQRLVPWLSYVSDTGAVSYIPGFDVEDADYSGYTKSVDTRVKGINDSGVIVGNSEGNPVKVEYVNEDDEEITYLVRGHTTRGFVDLNGNTVGLVSDSDLVGGYTEARDVNNSLMVAGLEIFNPREAITEAVETCNDEEDRGDQPLETCLQNLHATLFSTHHRRAVIWQLDTDGNVTDTMTYEVPFEPEEDDDRLFSSEALAINENGVAVGRTTNFFEDNTDFMSQYAAVFSGDEIISITDRNEYRSSIATDINDSNLVTGYAVKRINGIDRSKFFVYNTDSNEISFPDDFFPGSSSVARGINNNGQVVGEGEVETTLSSTRRREAFVYDVNDSTFQNLNDLLSCDSPYTIIQAHSINDSGQIAALARVRRAETDVQGNLALADDGSENLVDTFITVRLNPIPGGEIDSCDDDDDDTSAPDRQGGSTGWGLLLLPLVLLMRRFKR
ncbi:DUF3466 family protein [Planctobacterium marinum]|uniref:DUF3466 family protein n=1 Tax=Planctobacterium marinum TaxID=1631968 RepID=UPI001E504B4F|nr:DUF3466 family protein [Planctobacterium marinum]MCC2604358.1 DUF3466 family protein [Planctobacterium marinum]